MNALKQEIFGASAELRDVPMCNLGVVSYVEGRRIQEELIEKRLRGVVEDVLLCCEHPPTLSVGRRAAVWELGLSEDEWRSRGVDVEQVDRGGGVTLHLPGQMLIYPVIDLRGRRMGVKRFVEASLEAIARTVATCGLFARAEVNPAGVFASADAKEWFKVAFVGLRMVHGVTNHGFSVNIDCDLSLFSKFVPCCDNAVKISSIAALLSNPEKNLG